MVNLIDIDIYRSITDLAVCCETIRFNGECERCPLYDTETCLCDGTFTLTASKINAEIINKIICLADECTETEAERAKTAFDRKWEAEADYWNDRRCDPDDF